MERLGFIGLGKMGSGICNNLIKNGYEISIYDIDNSKLKRFKNKLKVVFANSAIEVLQNSDIIFFSLPSSKIVERLMDELIEDGMDGKTIIDLSTSYPISTQKIYRRVKEKGGTFIDAPLTGAPEDSEKGTQMLLFGGDKKQYEKLGPIFKCFCKSYKYIGKSGSGNIVKLILNFIGLSYVMLYAHAFPLAEKMELDSNLLKEIISDSFMGCKIFDYYAPKIISKSYDMAFAFELALKDLTYCRKLFEEYEVPAFSLDGTINLLRTGIKEGKGKKDYSECAALMYEYFNKK